MSSQKLLVVFGATGVQGGSVIKAILSDPKASNEFKLRAITRDPSKPKAKALEEKGVECVTGDVNDKESLRKALAGAYAVYAVTDYWAKMDKEEETQQGKNIADVAKEVRVQHMVYSSLFNVTKFTNGKITGVHHFDSKALVEEYIRSIGIPATFFMPAMYMSSLADMIKPNPQSEQHEYVWMTPAAPNSKFALLDTVDDAGKFVKGILLNREKSLGKQVYAAGGYWTPEQVMKEFTEVKPNAGKGAHYAQLPEETFKGFLAMSGMPEPVQNDFCEMLVYFDKYGYYGGAPLEESQKYASEPLTTWKEYIAKAPHFKDIN
ncbi:MAG: hypothetical protein M1834_002041 [Cirrosporium novae-zelandiae]|nr:MAG: hypothetical protein M1834_002041 [Cirrosporium novae-zelandiae]